MKAFLRLWFVLLSVMLSNIACADNLSIRVHDAWIREAPPGAGALGGYMTIVNPLNVKQSLVGVSATYFGSAMIHRTLHENGVARMRHYEEVIIPANGSFSFEPDGYHLMLMSPDRVLRSGDKIPVTLEFADDSQIAVVFEVRKLPIN